jgi:DNA-binding GntR family transcriptional regulator
VSSGRRANKNNIVDNIGATLQHEQRAMMGDNRMVAAKGASKTVRATAARSQTDDLLGELRRRIVSHEWPPGSRLREHELADEFHVSRARIRGAFGILEERGLIECVPNRGAVVIRLQLDRIFELFEVREVLEAQMVRLAAEKAPPETWDDLIALFGAPAEAAVADNDLDAYVDAISQFRQRCIAAAGNEVLKGLLDSLYDRTQVMIRRLVLVPGRAREGMRQHQEILRAMRAGDAQIAEHLKRENIRSAREWFQNYQKYLL